MSSRATMPTGTPSWTTGMRSIPRWSILATASTTVASSVNTIGCGVMISLAVRVLRFGWCDAAWRSELTRLPVRKPGRTEQREGAAILLGSEVRGRDDPYELTRAIHDRQASDSVPNHAGSDLIHSVVVAHGNRSLRHDLGQPHRRASARLPSVARRAILTCVHTSVNPRSRTGYSRSGRAADSVCSHRASKSRSLTIRRAESATGPPMMSEGPGGAWRVPHPHKNEAEHGALSARPMLSCRFYIVIRSGG
jgi:hypothetical protein